MRKHTPGPWLNHEEHREGSDQFSWRITDVCESEVVCTKTAWSDTADKEDRNRIRANMLLIAAAPDLLEACKQSLQELEVFFHGYHIDADKNPTVILLRSAIARATSE